jgi:hypothetical protein
MYCHIRDYAVFSEMDPCNYKDQQPYTELMKKMSDFIAPPRASPVKGTSSAGSLIDDSQRSEPNGEESVLAPAVEQEDEAEASTEKAADASKDED